MEEYNSNLQQYPSINKSITFDNNLNIVKSDNLEIPYNTIEKEYYLTFPDGRPVNSSFSYNDIVVLLHVLDKNSYEEETYALTLLEIKIQDEVIGFLGISISNSSVISLSAVQDTSFQPQKLLEDVRFDVTHYLANLEKIERLCKNVEEKKEVGIIVKSSKEFCLKLVASINNFNLAHVIITDSSYDECINIAECINNSYSKIFQYLRRLGIEINISVYGCRIYEKEEIFTALYMCLFNNAAKLAIKSNNSHPIEIVQTFKENICTISISVEISESNSDIDNFQQDDLSQLYIEQFAKRHSGLYSQKYDSHIFSETISFEAEEIEDEFEAPEIFSFASEFDLEYLYLSQIIDNFYPDELN